MSSSTLWNVRAHVNMCVCVCGLLHGAAAQLDFEGFQCDNIHRTDEEENGGPNTTDH